MNALPDVCPLTYTFLFRRTPIIRFPRVSGQEIDLHQFYTAIITRGGWNKVNQKDDWDDVMRDLCISTKCINSTIALKQIYVRYLERYERVHFLGDSIDRMDDEDDDAESNRHRKLSVRSLHSVPQTYNYSQHYLSGKVCKFELGLKIKICNVLQIPSEYNTIFLNAISRQNTTSCCFPCFHHYQMSRTLRLMCAP